MVEQYPENMVFHHGCVMVNHVVEMHNWMTMVEPWLKHVFEYGSTMDQRGSTMV